MNIWIYDICEREKEKKQIPRRCVIVRRERAVEVLGFICTRLWLSQSHDKLDRPAPIILLVIDYISLSDSLTKI